MQRIYGHSFFLSKSPPYTADYTTCSFKTAEEKGNTHAQKQVLPLWTDTHFPRQKTSLLNPPVCSEDSALKAAKHLQTAGDVPSRSFWQDFSAEILTDCYLEISVHSDFILYKYILSCPDFHSGWSSCRNIHPSKWLWGWGSTAEGDGSKPCRGLFLLSYRASG